MGWMRHIVNSNDDPILSTLAEFQIMIDSMTELQYFNIGNHSGMMPQNLLGTQHHTKTLRRLFRHLTINISPYEDHCPIEEDPYSIFKNRYSYRGTSTNSNPSASPSSTASTVSIEDFIRTMHKHPGNKRRGRTKQLPHAHCHNG